MPSPQGGGEMRFHSLISSPRSSRAGRRRRCRAGHPGCIRRATRATSSRTWPAACRPGPCGRGGPTMAAPSVPLFVQLPQVMSCVAGEGGAVGLRAGEDVVLVRLVAAALDHLALLGERRLLGEVVVGAVQVRDILGDRPRPWRSATARGRCGPGVDRRRAARGLGARDRRARSCRECRRLRPASGNAGRRPRGRRDPRLCRSRRW